MNKTGHSFWESLGWQKYGDDSFSRLIETNSLHVYSLIYNEKEARWLLYDSRRPMRPCLEAPASNPAAAFDAAIAWIDTQGFLLKRDKVEVAMAQPDRSLNARTVDALESMATSFASFATGRSPRSPDMPTETELSRIAAAFERLAAAMEKAAETNEKAITMLEGMVMGMKSRETEVGL